MKEEVINEMKKRGYILPRSKDIPRIKSLIESSRSVASATLTIPLNKNTSTLVFRELYESIRQLGDALWWATGFEVQGSHEASMKILATAEIKEKLSLNKLDRFRKIRNDSNYRGYIISTEQAKEIVNFWKRCSSDIISFIENKMK